MSIQLCNGGLWRYSGIHHQQRLSNTTNCTDAVEQRHSVNGRMTMNEKRQQQPRRRNSITTDYSILYKKALSLLIDDEWQRKQSFIHLVSLYYEKLQQQQQAAQIKKLIQKETRLLTNSTSTGSKIVEPVANTAKRVSIESSTSVNTDFELSDSSMELEGPSMTETSLDWSTEDFECLMEPSTSFTEETEIMVTNIKNTVVTTEEKIAARADKPVQEKCAENVADEACESATDEKVAEPEVEKLFEIQDMKSSSPTTLLQEEKNSTENVSKKSMEPVMVTRTINQAVIETSTDKKEFSSGKKSGKAFVRYVFYILFLIVMFVAMSIDIVFCDNTGACTIDKVDIDQMFKNGIFKQMKTDDLFRDKRIIADNKNKFNSEPQRLQEVNESGNFKTMKKLFQRKR